MQLCTISDTHEKHQLLELYKTDILIHSGDATMNGKCKKSKDFLIWMCKQPAAYKIFVPGNHDLGFGNHLSEELLSFAKEHGIRVLIDKALELEGHKFYGSPWTPSRGKYKWALDKKTDGSKEKEIWSKIPEDTEILITHVPPYGIADRSFNGESLGCRYLRERLEYLPKLKLHIFGHVHERHGTQILKINNREVKFINAASWNHISFMVDDMNEPIYTHI